MSQIPGRSGRTIAAQIADRAPMAVVRRLAVAGLDEAARRTGRRRGLAVGAIDETGQLKAASRTAGVQRQYLGCAGTVASEISTVHLAYVPEGTGHALIGAREWIPAGHLKDPAKSAVMGPPADLAFRTKAQPGIDILAGAFADGVQLDFVSGEAVDGSCTALREFCEAYGQACVLRGPVQLPAAPGRRHHAHLPAPGSGSSRGKGSARAGTSSSSRWKIVRWTVHRSGCGSASISCQDEPGKRTRRSLTYSPCLGEFLAGERGRVIARAGVSLNARQGGASPDFPAQSLKLRFQGIQFGTGNADQFGCFGAHVAPSFRRFQAQV